MRTGNHILLAVIATFAIAAPAASAPRPRDLWATINVCDTASQPDSMGVRARMPGDGTRQRMYMRFRAQFFEDNRWEDVGGNARSRWLHVGSARVRHREAGYTFRFDPPRAGDRFVVRGVVDFRWRDRRRVVRRARANTKGGYESTRGADPPGYSAGVCEIRG